MRRRRRNARCALAVFLPPQARTQRVPVLYWLSGLTCTEDNFIAKAGAQRMAAELGIALVVPDTSPRGIVIPGDRESYDFGVGAGFYVDATHDALVRALPDVQLRGGGIACARRGAVSDRHLRASAFSGIRWAGTAR